MSEPSRRQLLSTVAVGCAACGMVACVSPLYDTGNTGGGSGSASHIPAGNVSDYFAGDLVAIVGWGVAVGYDQGGLYALSTICTHAGCDMANYGRVDSHGLFCSCHGSEFDVDGNVVRGPAYRALDHYQITVEANGDIFVDSTSVVGESARVAA